MEADWDELIRIDVPPPTPGQGPTPASAVAFDNQEELLWVGNEFGRVTSFHGPGLRIFTSFRAHPSNEGIVKQFLFHPDGVVSLAPTSVHLASRNGLTIWHLSEPNMTKLACMSYMGKNQRHIIVAGCQDVMFKIDVKDGHIVETLPTEYEYLSMKPSKYICAATTTGSVNLLDIDNLRVVNILNTNNIRICDMDAQHYFLVTCGWVNRPQGTPMLAGLANVHDLKLMGQLNPVAFHAGAAFVQLHPKMSTTCLIASQSGQIQVIDLVNIGNINLRQANIPNGIFLSGFVLSPSGRAIAMWDDSGTIYLWGSVTQVSQLRFTDSGGSMLEWGTTAEASRMEANHWLSSRPSPQKLTIDGDEPFSLIGVPYYFDRLLSVLPSLKCEVGNPPPRIDPDIWKNAHPHEVGLMVRNPRKIRRNQAEKTRTAESNEPSIAVPKFLSEKARDQESDSADDRKVDEVQEALLNASLSGVTKSEVPLVYRNVEIKYSRFGVDDFDFEYYNKTKYSGLETHITNSYMNPLLQLLRFTPLVRNLALHHTATNCLSDTCLLCEMGFLFDTLEKAEGQNCQATNLLKTFSSIPQAGGLGVLEESSHGNSLTEMIQSACRFFLSHTHVNYKQMSFEPDTGPFEKTFATDAISGIRCVSCHNETTRPGATLQTDLIWLPIAQGHRSRNQVPTFSQVLKASIELHTQTRGWCDKCRRYQQLATRKSINSVPDVLVINAALKSIDAKQYLAAPGWLPASIGVIIEQGKFFCFEGEDLRLHLEKRLHRIKVYDLVGIIADVNSGERQKSHLVSLINVDISERETVAFDNWHLFNDFLVQKVSKEDALKFSPSWKLPSILAYQVSAARHAIDDSWKEALDTSLLYSSYSINNLQPDNCQPLDRATEAPEAQSYVAIDTEFVNLQQEEIEIKADGERQVVRPTRDGLARVSVLRGSGEYEGLPFINDYITIREEIVDYLTKWSGVEVGDLDPQRSHHSLVPLKVAYKKLWLLLNLGCIFIGHGLRKDFRTINIYVPQAQVYDTVDLFYIKSRGRKLSLRFLAWYLLKEDIQQGNHDSIEDAHTALRLWRKSKEFEDAGIIERMVEEIYREGKKWNYKPPGEAMGVGGRFLGVPDGRDTPDIQSGPGTPLGKRLLGRGSEYFNERASAP